MVFIRVAEERCKRDDTVPDPKSIANLYLVLIFLVPGLVASFVRAQFV